MCNEDKKYWALNRKDKYMMSEHLRLLQLAANNDLPDTIDKETDLPLDIFRELVEGGYLKAMDAGEFGEDAYKSPRITMSGREYLERLKSEKRRDVDNILTSQIRLFISHSAADRDLVEKMLEMLRAALDLPASQIRCTSVDGYRLPAGADTEEQLRLEVHEATALVGVISASSLRSLYVAFELGARWGARRPLFPLLAPGTGPNILEGPLASLNALSSESPAQLHQLISDLSSVLQVKSEEPAVYQRYVDAILALPKEARNTHKFDINSTSGVEQGHNLPRLKFFPPFYYADDDPVPFCPACWEIDRVRIHYSPPLRSGGESRYICPRCSRKIDVQG
jgi:hypothetical protein